MMFMEKGLLIEGFVATVKVQYHENGILWNMRKLSSEKQPERKNELIFCYSKHRKEISADISTSR